MSKKLLLRDSYIVPIFVDNERGLDVLRRLRQLLLWLLRLGLLQNLILVKTIICVLGLNKRDNLQRLRLIVSKRVLAFELLTESLCTACDIVYSTDHRWCQGCCCVLYCQSLIRALTNLHLSLTTVNLHHAPLRVSLRRD